MRTKFILVLAALLTQAFSAAAQTPKEFSTSDVFSLYNKSKNINQSANFLQIGAGTFNHSAEPKIFAPGGKFLSNNSAPVCSDSGFGLNAAQAAACNGASVTSIVFNETSRTIVSGVDNRVGVVYRYSNAGTAPDGTVLDALVTVLSYNNNQDADQTNFSSADVPGATAGFEDNLQPNLNQESGTFLNNSFWQGSLNYRIQFVRTGTTTPRVITVAATTTDNDGGGVCNSTLRESVTYSSGRNQILINTPNATTQTVAGNVVTGPTTNQALIGSGSDYAAAALYINVSEINWAYSFTTPTNAACTAGNASAARYGSLNLSCQITFDQPFVSVPLSGTVFNDANGLTDSTVNGTGIGLPSGVQLYANLLDSNNNVVSTATVAANGVYTFPTAFAGSYNVQISTNQGVESSPAPVAALPAGWVATGENLGAGAGNDGTVNSLLAATVGSVAVTDANFGIEQRPVANTNTAASQTNPGGTANATVPATTFSATDGTPGTVANIRITAFPTNATSITINGTQYTAANFPAGGVTVPTNASGNPTQPVLVDPIDGATTVGILYVAIDNAGVVSSAAATANVPFAVVSISGAVLNDLNGLTDGIVNGAGTNAGGPLYANLLRGGSVVQTILLPSSGAYSFSGLNVGDYTVQISINQGTVGSTAPATALPAGWVNTGEFVGTAAGNDGSVNGLLPVSIGTTAISIANANFGIEQRPTANNNTATSRTNPGGTNRATVPATTFTATDLSGGTVANIRVTAFPSNATSFTVGTTTYYPNAGAVPATCPTATCAAFPVAGITIATNTSGNPTPTVQVDPIDGAVTVGILYVAVDNAGVESAAPATASVPFATVAVSGAVFNDVNGLTDNLVNGTVPNTGAQLYANLLDANGIVLQTVSIPTSTGLYSFANLNSGSYTVQISTNQGTAGVAAPATALPNGWVNTGEFIGTGVGNDGTVNGLLPVTVAAVAIVNANFGIEQRPVANNNTAASQANPGGTVNIAVPASTFTATDTATVSSLRIVAFPTNVTSITINGTQYTAANFPAGGVTVPTNAAGNPTQPILIDPVNGAGTAVIRYVAIDNAGVESAAPASASVPFTNAPTSGGARISGTLYFGASPLPNTLVVLVDTGSNSKFVTRTDLNGVYSFSGKEVGRTYVVQPLSSKYVFGSKSSVVNLQSDVADLNFNSSAKKYHPKNDFDGDGKSDEAVFRPSEGNWYVLKSSDGQMSVFNFGASGDVPVSADYDGDGKSDYAVFRPSEGNWYIWQSKTQDLRVENFGLAADKLVPADFDGDGKADVAVYRDGNWYIRRSSDGTFEAKNFGLDTDAPTTEDFDGDGRADLSVYRASNYTWYSLSSSNDKFFAVTFGLGTDVPVAADYDGDGFADIAQYRKGNWFFLGSTTGFETIQNGSVKDKSIVGDYDGDGRSDATVYRNGIWLIRNSGDGALRRVDFGLENDVLVK